ncbi:hypothetical protein tb265_49730 [Gemmatimonadetes bacterium T265]|nr:hypothetical protein tb265_49730 [Gemmatimonadetes bacterium T265]
MPPTAETRRADARCLTPAAPRPAAAGTGYDPRALTDALRRRCRGEVSAAPADRAAVAFDFGNMVRRAPQVVVRPRDVADVAHAVRTAREHGTSVTARATGHSLGGQALSAGGVLLDMRSLSRVARVAPRGRWVEAEGGAVWADVVEGTLAAGHTPPVLTSNLFTTVGGTHSVGGVGTASFRHGTHADNCLACEVVTADGDVRWCSPRRNAELFAHVLCGLGLFGVMTRLRLRVHPARRRTWTWRLAYGSPEALVADLLAAVLAGRADRIGGRAYPVEGGRRWAYVLDLAVDGDAEAPPAGVLRGLAPRLVAGPAARAFADAARSTERTDLRAVQTPSPCGHPWVDVFLPPAEVAAYVREQLTSLPPPLLAHAHLLFWPVTRAVLTRPLFAVPPAPVSILTSIMPTVPRARLPGAAAAMAAAARDGARRGGTHYLYGSVPADADAWARQFGSYWPRLQALKRRYDPDGVFHPDLLPGPEPCAAADRGAAVVKP